MISGFLSKRNQKQDETGLKYIKLCTLCKRYDHVDELLFRYGSGYYFHKACRDVSKVNQDRVNKGRKPAAHFLPEGIGKCVRCHNYSKIDESWSKSRTMHRKCDSTNSLNHQTIKKQMTENTTVSAMSGLPFDHSISALKAQGDHDHETLLYRGHIFQWENRLEGSVRDGLRYTNLTIDQICDNLKTYLKQPGKDIGLKPYPKIGFDTAQEAVEFYETTN